MSKISKLVATENKLIANVQKEYLSIIKKAIKKHGITKEAREAVKKDLTNLGAEMTKTALKMGVKWLK